jgi:hypothetical protein
MANQTLTITDTADDVLYNGTFYTQYLQWGDGNWGGASFVTTAQIPAGSTIDVAYFRCYLTGTNTGRGTATLGVEQANPGTNTRFSSGTHPVHTATTYTGVTSVYGYWIDVDNAYAFGPSDGLPLSLASQIQSLLDEFGTINVGGRINIKITGSNPDASNYCRAEDYSDGANHAQLYIEWTPGVASGIPKTTKLALLGVG